MRTSAYDPRFIKPNMGRLQSAASETTSTVSQTVQNLEFHNAQARAQTTTLDAAPVSDTHIPTSSSTSVWDRLKDKIKQLFS